MLYSIISILRLIYYSNDADYLSIRFRFSFKGRPFNMSTKLFVETKTRLLFEIKDRIMALVSNLESLLKPNLI